MKAAHDYASWLNLGKGKPRNSTSPFYSRIYAGYSAAQLECIVRHIAEGGGRLPIFDPMAGQAFALSTLSWFGHEVRINDINPAPLLLAWLRSASVLHNINVRISEFKIWLNDLKPKIDRLHLEHKKNIPFITGWLSESMIAQLQLYGSLASAGAENLSLSAISEWDERILFRLAVIVLAARRITCYSQSDNRTWLKPGGLDNKPMLSEAIIQELEIFQQSRLADEYYSRTGLFNDAAENKLTISCADVSRTELAKLADPCITITSPPYANRLDYSVMWAPELWVLSTAIPIIDRETIKTNQIGTTRIRNRVIDPDILSQLPASTREELRQIERSSEYASKSYYYPFFVQFALDLFSGLQHGVAAAPLSEKWIIFIRDTTRKDVMFSSHAICESVMESCGFKRREVDDLQIIRSHVGLMRRSLSKSSVYGLAQREWWLIFDREK